MKTTFTNLLAIHSVRLLAGLLWWLMSTLSLQAQTIYVTPEGAGQQTGADWANALPGSQLQPSLAAAGEGSVFRLAAGLYKPSATGDRMVSFIIPSGVQVVGGYTGSQADPSRRMAFTDPERPSSTTLSGDIDNDQQLNSANTDHVIRFLSANEQTVLDGVVVTGGNATSGGGAIYLNAYSGSITPVISNCFFIHNATTGSGGAIYAIADRALINPRFTNCSFLNNQAAVGGAFSNQSDIGRANMQFTNCRFIANRAEEGGVGNNYADGPRGSSSTASPQFLNCIFTQNAASVRGGVMVNNARGGQSTTSSPVFINCTLSGNQAPEGGAFYNTASSGYLYSDEVLSGPTLTNCILWDNGGATAIKNVFTNTPPATSSGNGFAKADHCILEAGTLIEGSSNLFISESPFLDEQSLRLRACSPAVNLGINTSYPSGEELMTDLAGNPRVYPEGGRIDIGAYEYQQQSPTVLIITQQPASQSTVVAGTTVETTVGLNTTAESYAWYKDGGLVSGQTSATLRLTHVQPEQAGSYFLVATSVCSSVTSTAFSLSVTTPPRLTHFWLINADTDQPLQELTAGTQLNLSTLPTRNLNIQAVTEPATVGSVAFSLSGQQSYQVVEGVVPYALFRDNQGDYQNWTPNLGIYSLTATPYAGANATGAIGTALTVDFTVVSQPGSQQLTHFWLINADTDQPIRELTDGQEVDLSRLPTRNLNIQAVTDPTPVGSVVFELSGRQMRRQVETVAPYALFGDTQGDYTNWTPELGSYTLVATPYSGAGGTKKAGVLRRVSFLVTNPGAARPATGRLETSLDMPWQVRVLGNPVTGSEVVVEVSGIQGQSLHYELLDGSGRLVHTHQVEQAGSLEHQRMHIGSQGAGMLLLRVSTPTHSQTVKILKQ